jgi:arylsulfatase A-like enzyme
MISRRHPNVVLLGIDSFLATHMSSYGYQKQTTPHIDHFAESGALFERTYSPHIPTTSAYASMLTGMDTFGTQVVALRHQGPLRSEVPTAAEIFRDFGYDTSCVGFTGNPSSRGFDQYFDYSGWGSLAEGRSHKAHNLNQVALPELERMAGNDQPFFLFLRHMDPHPPYLPPEPYDRAFYYGNEFDPANKSMDPVWAFKPFSTFFSTWMPEGVTDKDYIIAQYDGAIAYMDACIQRIFTTLEGLGILDDTIVAINGDHGETLYDHECWFDHHGIYDGTLHVPLILRYPKRIPAGVRVKGYNQHKDLLPTLLDLADLDPSKVDWPSDKRFDGRSLMSLVTGEEASFESEFYITECTWMRKHGWRTPEWKLIRALEPDFHFKPEIELYNLVRDPNENDNLAEKEPEMVALLTARMEKWISKREAETGLANPIYTQENWHGQSNVATFKTSQEAYDTLFIGGPKAGARLQAGDVDEEDEE